MKNLIRKKYHFIRWSIKIFIILLFVPIIYNLIPVHEGKTTFYLPSSDIDTVIDTLHENGYGVSIIDKYMLRFLETPKKGWYTVSKIPTKRFKFFESLNEQQSKVMSVKVFAGETSFEVTKRLAQNLKLNQEELLLEYRRLTRFLEGDIFAGRYNIARDADERAVITALFQKSSKKLEKFGQQFCDGTPNELEIKILMIMASIIQKETNNKKEMYIISSVIQNRLNKGMKLQMDGTLNYGEYSRKRITSKRIKKDRSYYNTYIHGGIPPAPLCTITMNALQAAVNPKKTDYLFFMLNRNGKHDFASTYKQHVKNIKAFRRKS